LHVRLPTRALAFPLLLALLSAPAAQADDTVAATENDSSLKPKWELGIAGAVGTEPDYPASDRYRIRPVGFPYFIYRGNFFRSDENGPRVRAQLQHDVELTVSGNASFGSHAEGSGPRAGMPKLDYLFELGPNVRITVLRLSADDSLRLDLPVRAVFSLNGLHTAYEGLTFEPLLGLHTAKLLGSGWSGYAGVGPEWGSGRFQRYFYQVDPQYALADRPAYQAHGGYLGSRVEIGAAHKLGRDFHIFLFGRVDNYAGAENEDSPLFKTRFGYTGLVGLSWTFLRSKDMVQVPKD
jgi:outer membrane scaffolding protein for murein synthesis (MipA/OmpV family)